MPWIYNPSNQSVRLDRKGGESFKFVGHSSMFLDRADMSGQITEMILSGRIVITKNEKHEQ